MQLLQGVFSALGGLAQPPPAAGAGPAAAAAGGPGPQQQQQQQGGEPVHLLDSIASYLTQLQAGGAGSGAAAPEAAMPVTSLALGGTAGELCRPFFTRAWDTAVLSG